MSEFDKLKGEAEKEAQQHPQQVKEGEQAVEKDLGLQQQGDPGQHGGGQAQQQGGGQAQQDHDDTGSGQSSEDPTGQGQ